MTVSIARPGLEQRIQEIIEPSLASMGYALIRVRYMYQPPTEPSKRDRRLKRTAAESSGQLQLMLERMNDTSFGIKDCSIVHRHVSVLLDVEDPIDHPFQLEVSSGGITRPLTKNSDFKDYLSRRVEVQLGQILEGRRRFKGVLLSADDEKIEIQQDDEHCFAVPLVHIVEARLLLEQQVLDTIKNNKNT